jgi:predicted transcriptional regulator
MAMTLRLSEDEQQALRERAEADGMSMHEAVRRAIRAYVDETSHREQVMEAAREGMVLYAEALDRLGR